VSNAEAKSWGMIESGPCFQRTLRSEVGRIVPFMELVVRIRIPSRSGQWSAMCSLTPPQLQELLCLREGLVPVAASACHLSSSRDLDSRRRPLILRLVTLRILVERLIELRVLIWTASSSSSVKD
jgi:hypothetical protein